MVQESTDSSQNLTAIKFNPELNFDTQVDAGSQILVGANVCIIETFFGFPNLNIAVGVYQGFPNHAYPPLPLSKETTTSQSLAFTHFEIRIHDRSKLLTLDEIKQKIPDYELLKALKNVDLDRYYELSQSKSVTAECKNTFGAYVPREKIIELLKFLQKYDDERSPS